MRKAIYPGTFDPLTEGHMDVIRRSVKLFDELIVAVSQRAEKTPLFSVEERVEMLRVATTGLGNVRITSFDGLLVNFAAQQGAIAVVRGLRAIADFEYEFQMALMNRRLAPFLETVFLVPSEKHSFVSSSLVREIMALGGDVSPFVPEQILPWLRVSAVRDIDPTTQER
jgi:pantetheine-phosphate adenylyltransferase